MGIFDFIKRKARKKTRFEQIQSDIAVGKTVVNSTGVHDILKSDSYRDGSSAERAVIITTTHRFLGIPAEYAYVASICGQQGPDWTTQHQSLISRDGKSYDVLSILTNAGVVREFWFDITAFHGH